MSFEDLNVTISEDLMVFELYQWVATLSEVVTLQQTALKLFSFLCIQIFPIQVWGTKYYSSRQAARETTVRLTQ